jgi:uncharacterized protein (UPF0333 family)
MSEMFYTKDIMTKQQSFLLLAVLVIVGGGAGYYFTQGKAAKAPEAAQVVTKSYNADMTYAVPTDKKETLHLAVTLENGVITDFKFTTDTPDNIASKENIESFQQAFAAMSFKGKKLSEVSVSRLGGASLTSAAFMQAVAKISAQANNG